MNDQERLNTIKHTKNQRYKQALEDSQEAIEKALRGDADDE